MMTIIGLLLFKSKMVLVTCIADILISQLSASIKWLRNFSLHSLTFFFFFAKLFQTPQNPKNSNFGQSDDLLWFKQKSAKWCFSKKEKERGYTSSSAESFESGKRTIKLSIVLVTVQRISAAKTDLLIHHKLHLRPRVASE